MKRLLLVIALFANIYASASTPIPAPAPFNPHWVVKHKDPIPTWFPGAIARTLTWNGWNWGFETRKKDGHWEINITYKNPSTQVIHRYPYFEEQIDGSLYIMDYEDNVELLIYPPVDHNDNLVEDWLTVEPELTLN